MIIADTRPMRLYLGCVYMRGKGGIKFHGKWNLCKNLDMKKPTVRVRKLKCLKKLKISDNYSIENSSMLELANPKNVDYMAYFRPDASITLSVTRLHELQKKKHSSKQCSKTFLLRLS